MHEPFLAKIEFCELHLHISTWPLVIVPGRPLLVIKEDGSLGGERGARNQQDIRSGDRNRSKKRRQQAQAPTEREPRGGQKKILKAAD